MLRQGTPAPEFADADALKAHYRAVQTRLWAPRKVCSGQEMTVASALALAQREREREEAAERAAAARAAVVLQDEERVRALAAQVVAAERLTGDPRRVITDVAATFGFSHADIVGPRKLIPLVRARWAAIDAVHAARPDLSLNRLGRIFGRDHTTIRHALAIVAAEGVPQPPAQGEPT